jgi:methyl-accepting chemotaxis protein
MMSSRRFWLISFTVLAAATALAGWLLVRMYLQSYTTTVADRLQLLNQLRQGAIQQYFATAEAELTFWATSPGIMNGQQKLNGLWEASSDKPAALAGIRQRFIEDNPHDIGQYRNLVDVGDGTPYNAFHAELHPLATLFVTQRGYYDVFLMGTGGDVFYTVEKEDEYGTNLLDGRWRDSGLADVFRKAKGQEKTGAVVMSDMQAYGPSDGAPAIFIARSIMGPDGAFLGVIAFQLPTAKILAIMNYTSGMGETGETYLVGQDQLMRSDSRFTSETDVLKQIVSTGTVIKALAGQRGVEFIEDYRGIDVLSAYDSLAVGETRWAVMAEIDREEIKQSAAEDRPSLTGILLFFYGLSLWSVWYWRGGMAGDGDNTQYALLDLDLEAGDFGDSSG